MNNKRVAIIGGASGITIVVWLVALVLLRGVSSEARATASPPQPVQPTSPAPTAAAPSLQSHGSNSPNIIGNQNIVNSPGAAISAAPPPRHLSAPQQKAVSAAVSPLATSFAVIALDGDQEAMWFAQHLETVLATAGWKKSNLDLALASFSGPISGVWVTTSSEPSKPAARALATILAKKGVPARAVTAWGMSPETSGGVTIIVGSYGDTSQTQLPGMKSLSAAKVLSQPKHE